jgi:hypothetical protein
MRVSKKFAALLIGLAWPQISEWLGLPREQGDALLILLVTYILGQSGVDIAKALPKRPLVVAPPADTTAAVVLPDELRATARRAEDLWRTSFSPPPGFRAAWDGDDDDDDWEDGWCGEDDLDDGRRGHGTEAPGRMIV